MGSTDRKRILFIAEAVTLAHVVRPLVLAQSLDSERYEVHFASANRYGFLLQKSSLRFWQINSISSDAFLRALSQGARLYNYRTLDQYVADDLQLIRDVTPDLVVGDFRLSLAVSAAVAKVPYAAIANAYWSPYASATSFPLPDLWMSRLMGYPLANAIFQFLRPLIFDFHAAPLNRLRKKYGLSKLNGLCDAYTHGDYTLYVDPPDFFPVINLPANHRFIGPIDWSPDIPLPDWWHQLPTDSPRVYVNLGSSGAAELLPVIAEALSSLPLTVIMATANRWQPKSVPSNIRLCDFVSGSDAVQSAKMVICNGGSPSVYQALSHGVPVIGIASNMDQRLSMQAVERTGCGILIRSEAATARTIRDAVSAVRAGKRYQENAQTLQAQLRQVDARERFRCFLSEVLANP